jgi:peptidoglycan/LPS O-acetylase OafA/YrhL
MFFSRLGPTFGDVLRVHKGEGPGFALLRLGLAAAIFLFHIRILAEIPGFFQGAPPHMPPVGGAVTGLMEYGWTGPSRPFYVVLVPAFFALSGFLVTGSALRIRKTTTFLAFRGLRIFPALATEVTLCALVIGPLYTTLPSRAYFSDPQFWRYFGNIIGWITFLLPGVFETSEQSVVNGNLWTLPSEFNCYFLTAILMVTGVIYSRVIFTSALLIVTIALIVMNISGDFGVTNFSYNEFTITYYFFVGMAFFCWRDKLPASWLLFSIASIAGYALLYSRHTIFLAPVFVVYSTVFLGVRGIPEITWLKTRDYSYGLYLYGFPISQAVIASFAFVRGSWWAAFISLAVTILFAGLSWRYIEKPTLSLKNKLPKRFFPTLSVQEKAALELRYHPSESSENPLPPEDQVKAAVS